MAPVENSFKSGFTLAEVLITLGIIGVVAAMTLPTVIKKYRRQVVATKLEKFYSIMNQAIKSSIAEYGEIPLENQFGTESNNSAYITEWYKTYITKYIKLLKEEGPEKNSAYYRVAFLDGSGFNSYFSSPSEEFPDRANMYIFFCLDYSKCDYGQYDGINQFLFLYLSDKEMVVPCYSGGSEKGLKNQCYSANKGERWGCAALIEQNGWKIPEDYPWL